MRRLSAPERGDDFLLKGAGGIGGFLLGEKGRDGGEGGCAARTLGLGERGGSGRESELEGGPNGV